MSALESMDGPPISVLGRAVSLLHCFDRSSHRELTLAAITKMTALPKPTVHRLLSELVDLGLVERTSNTYRLGIQLFELGLRVDRTISLEDVAMPGIQQLFEATRKTVHFAVLDGPDVVYLGKFKARNAPALPTEVGGRMPAYCTAVGKVMLAHASRATQRAVLETHLQMRTRQTITAPGLLGRQFEAIVRTGLGYDSEESTLGVACVAAPIYDSSGGVVAAVSVTGRVTSFDPVKMGFAARAAATTMSQTLQRPDPSL